MTTFKDEIDSEHAYSNSLFKQDEIIVLSPEQVEIFKLDAQPFEYNESLGIIRGYVKDNRTLITEVMINE